MSFYRCEIKVISRGARQSAAAAHQYDTRQSRRDRSDLQATGSANMPAWAQPDPGKYWEACDRYERANGSLARRAIISFPNELPTEDREQYIREWLQSNCPNMPASWAIHDDPKADPSNPHAHILISERQQDGIDRAPELFFKRYNAKNPAKGGARKADIGSRRKKWLKDARESWASILNKRLPPDAQVDHRSLKDRSIHDHDPQPKIGAKVLGAEARGIRTRLMSSIIEDSAQRCTVRCLSFVDQHGREVTFRAARDFDDRIEVVGKPSTTKCREMVKMCKERGWASVEVSGTPEFQQMMRAELRRAGIRFQGEEYEQNNEHHRGAHAGSGESERGLYGSRSLDRTAPNRGEYEPDRGYGRGQAGKDGGAGTHAERPQAAPEAGAVPPATGTAAANRAGGAGGDLAGKRHDIHALARPDGVPANTKAGGDVMHKDLTYILVSKQVKAMHGVETFEVGIRDGRSGKMQNIEMGRADVLASVPRLKRENAKGCDIYIRPSPKEQHPHAFVLLDDVPIGTINQMRQDGLQFVLEVETSPLNYQTLIRLPENLARADRKAVERVLQERYRSDLNSADGGHYMRLSGFTNRKPKHGRDDGSFPFVKLSYSKPDAVLTAAVWQPLKAQAEQREADEISDSPLPKALPLAPALPVPGGVIVSAAQVRASMQRQYHAAHEKWGARFDPSRADYFIARNLLQRGATVRSVNFAMQDLSPDLATRKAGHVEDYVRRTALKAYQSLPELAERDRELAKIVEHQLESQDRRERERVEQVLREQEQNRPARRQTMKPKP